MGQALTQRQLQKYTPEAIIYGSIKFSMPSERAVKGVCHGWLTTSQDCITFVTAVID